MRKDRERLSILVVTGMVDDLHPKCTSNERKIGGIINSIISLLNDTTCTRVYQSDKKN